MSAPFDNRNAAKDNPRTSTLHIRCHQSDKARWVRAAGGVKLARWVTDTLNGASQPERGGPTLDRLVRDGASK